MTRLSQIQAIEFVESYNTTPDHIGEGIVEAFLADPAADVLTDLENFAPGIDPDSYEITPDVIEGMGIWGAKVVIRTGEGA